MTTIGRRERKKLQTRQALAEAALSLFLERGYDNVTVAQIAEAADVSLATLFKHVPGGKEALIFDDGTERREGLVAAVRNRPDGVPILDALHDFLAARGAFATDLPPDAQRLRDLIVSTPALRRYQRRLWLTGESALAEAIAAESGRPASDPAARALSRYVLETPELAALDPDPRASLRAIFSLLATGWTTSSAAAEPARQPESPH